MCSSAPPPISPLFPPREVLFHRCTYCKVFPLPPSLTTSTWPITDDSLYTHKQNKAQTVITELLHAFTHAAQQSVSLLPLSLFGFFSLPSLPLSFFLPLNVSLSFQCTTHTHIHALAQYGCGQHEQNAATPL